MIQNSVAVGAALLLSMTPSVVSHGYLKSPKSRNYEAWEKHVEYCPHCLNRGGTLAECGISGSNNYDSPVVPQVNKPTYAKGSIIDFDVVLTAHHKGHMTFKACPISPGEIPTADCFDNNVLEFVSDELYGATKDTNYPDRAYIAPLDYSGLITSSSPAGLAGALYRFRFKLPDNVVGDSVLLQWHYWTANSCEYEGYNSYQFPSDWNVQTGALGLCTNIPEDGNGIPEQFWNCAEVAIVDGPAQPTTSAPVPAPGGPPVGTGGYPTNPPMSPPTPAPVIATPSPVTMGPTVAPVGPVTMGPTVAPVGPSPTPAPIASPTMAPVTPAPVDSSQWEVSNVNFRCGRGSNAEVDARGNCRAPCTHPIQCGDGETCTAVFPNYCGSKPAIPCENYEFPSTTNRCGTSEMEAREKCGAPCTSYSDCDAGQWCFPVHPNFCECETGSRKMLRKRA